MFKNLFLGNTKVDFYKKSKSVFAIVATGDTEKYANIILKKGVTPN